MTLQKIDIDADVFMEIANHEAIILETYKDSKGIETAFMGITNATGHDVHRYIGKPQSMEYAISISVWALSRYVQAVLQAFEGYKLTKAEFAAALSFHYNTGGIARASWVRLIKAGQRDAAYAAIMQWNKPAEIVDRRRKERDLFFDGHWSNTGKTTVYTKVNPRTLAPVWSSAKTVDIREAVNRALSVGGSVSNIPDAVRLPDKVVVIENPKQEEYTAPNAWVQFTGWIKKLLS